MDPFLIQLPNLSTARTVPHRQSETPLMHQRKTSVQKTLSPVQMRLTGLL